MFRFTAYMATDYNPHFESGLRMKNTSIKLDRVVHRLLVESNIGPFSIMELRDHYLTLVDPVGVSSPGVRMYLYDQIRRMVQVGWAEHHEERKSRGQQFVVLDKPLALTPKLVKPGKGMLERQRISDVAVLSVADKPTVKESVPNTQDELATKQLQRMLKEARLDLLTSYGETERYAQMLEEIPTLRGSLESDLIASRDNSSRLLGHVKALESAIQKLGVM